jgi:hypothetical protein
MFIPACWWVHIDSLQKLWDNAFQLNQFMWVHPKKNIEHSPWRYLSFLQPEWPQLRHAWRHVGNPSWTGEDKWPERASMFPWKGGTLERWDWTDIIYIIRYIYIHQQPDILYIYTSTMGYYIYIHQQWDIIYIYPIVDTWGIELKPMKAICFTHWIWRCWLCPETYLEWSGPDWIMTNLVCSEGLEPQKTRRFPSSSEASDGLYFGGIKWLDRKTNYQAKSNKKANEQSTLESFWLIVWDLFQKGP